MCFLSYICMLQRPRTISTTQFSLLVIFIVIAGKCFSLPLMLLEAGGRNAWAALALFLLADLLALAIFLIFFARRPDKTAFELIEEKLGKVASKILAAALFVFLGVKILYYVLDFSGFIGYELFDGMPKSILLIPLALMLAAFGARSLRAVGRTAEIFVYAVVAALILILCLLFVGADFTRLLPLWGGEAGDGFSRMFMLYPLHAGDFTALFIAQGLKKITQRGGELCVTPATVEPSKITQSSPPPCVKLAPFLSAVGASAVAMLLGLLIFATFTDVTRLMDASQNTLSATHTGIARFSFGRFDKIAYAALSATTLLLMAVWFLAAVQTLRFVVDRGQLPVDSEVDSSVGVDLQIDPQCVKDFPAGGSICKSTPTEAGIITQSKLPHSPFATRNSKASSQLVISIALAIGVYFAAVFVPMQRLCGFLGAFGIYFVPVFALGFPLLLLILSIKKRKNEKSQ